MSFIQRFFTTVLPRRAAASMEAESRAWKARCPGCGFAKSVWEMGGIRWKAKGEPRVLLRCPGCGQRKWLALARDPAPGGAPDRP